MTDEPCDCAENAFCPHFNKTLKGHLFRYSKEDTDIARRYRSHWRQQAQQQPQQQGCGCKGKVRKVR